MSGKQKLYGFLLLILCTFVLLPQRTSAQSETPSYWSYSATDEIKRVVVTDLDGDGFQEFLVVSGTRNLEVVNPDGTPLWEEAYQSAEAILDVAHLQTAIVIATANRLVWLNHDQTLLNHYPFADGQTPNKLTTLQRSTDSNLLIEFADGSLQLLNASSELLWERPPAEQLTLRVADIDVDGADDIVLALACEVECELEESTSLSRLEPQNGDIRWSVEIAEQITAITSSQQTIAVGTASGKLHLLNSGGHPLWQPRTLNTPITALTTTEWDSNPLLIAGTETGKIVAFGYDGKRVWDQATCLQAGRLTLTPQRCDTGIIGRITTLSAPSTNKRNQPLAFTATVERDGDAQILLVDTNLEPLAQYPTKSDLPQLIDSNGDGLSELLLVAFGNIQVVHPGTRARSALPLWEFSLQEPATTSLVSDLDGDGDDELLVGTSKRIYRIEENGSVPWIEPVAGSISQLRLLDDDNGETLILFAYDTTQILDDEREVEKGFINLMRPDSTIVWDNPLIFQGHVTALYIDYSQADVTLIVGTSDNSLTGYRLVTNANEDGSISWHPQELWRKEGFEPAIYITQLDLDGTLQLLIATEFDLRHIDEEGLTLFYFSTNTTPPTETAGCLTPPDLLFLLDRGTVASLDCMGRSIGEWQTTLGTATQPLDRSTTQFFYRPIAYNQWLQFERDVLSPDDNIQDDVPPQLEAEQYQVIDYLAADLTNDGLNDFVLAQADGTIILDLNETERTDLVTIERGILEVASLRSAPNTPADLAVLTDNAEVRLFRFRPNYPPLLTNPTFELSEDQYNIRLSVFDIEQEAIDVSLELYDPLTDSWQLQGEIQRASDSESNLLWSPDLSEHPDEAVRYRFRYTDGDDHQAILEPPLGPAPLRATPILAYLAITGASFFVLFVGGIAYIRQRNQPASQARRFYSKLRRAPVLTLTHLRERYNKTGGSPEWLLGLANTARQNQDITVANLADGLYLLDSQPRAGLPIISSTLERISEDTIHDWHDLSVWRTMFETTSELLNAPTITELSLLRPELEAMLDINSRTGGDSGPFPELRPIFDSLRDSERVASVDDRLTYLNDALTLLKQLDSHLVSQPRGLSLVLVKSLTNRWLGMVEADIEALRGRARLDLQLKTQQIAPSDETWIALEVRNSGRARAEHIFITLEEGEAQPLGNRTVLIPSLAPGRVRSLEFPIRLPATDRFRVAFSIEFNDRQRSGKSFDYANVIHVLTPLRDFEPIPNPYSPGTPLRKHSPLFFGRTDLFNFISEEAKHISRKHVLILVGQRRTGKTSMLLRLGDHLPPHLLPVYIDCQSLGVLPGMTAFLQDVAWLVADTLLAHDIDIDVPDLETLHDNPGTWFQKRFIPEVQSKLSAETQIMLVFDEFEALENLVDDGILPNTVFRYLRHLMQHCDGLSFVFVGTHRLEQMTTNYWSVLFNIALYKEIGYLSKHATHNLITQPVAPHIVYDDLAIDKIWRITAGHPYFLQLVCYSLVKRANATRTGYVTISDVNATVDEMLGLGEVHFAFIWQRSSSAERAILIAIAHLIDKESLFRPADLVQALQPFNIYFTPTEVTEALNSLVQRNIMAEINDGVTTYYELKVGLVGMWIEQTKSLSKLHSEKQPLALLDY